MDHQEVTPLVTRTPFIYEPRSGSLVVVIGSKKMSDRNDETKGNEEIIFHRVVAR